MTILSGDGGWSQGDGYVMGILVIVTVAAVLLVGAFFDRDDRKK